MFAIVGFTKVQHCRLRFAFSQVTVPFGGHHAAIHLPQSLLPIHLLGVDDPAMASWRGLTQTGVVKLDGSGSPSLRTRGANDIQTIRSTTSLSIQNARVLTEEVILLILVIFVAIFVHADEGSCLHIVYPVTYERSKEWNKRETSASFKSMDLC